jgi:hypothetical protein
MNRKPKPPTVVELDEWKSLKIVELEKLREQEKTKPKENPWTNTT